MIKCSEVLKELEAYRKDKTTSDFSREINRHLQTCSDCQEELTRLNKLDALLDNYTVPVSSPNFQARLHKKISLEEEKASESSYRFSINWRKAGSLAAAALILITFTLWIINPSGVDNNVDIAVNDITSEQETEIIENLDLLETFETAQVIDYLTDYDLVEVFPELMEIDFNGTNGQH